MTPDPVVARLTRIAEQLARRSADAPTDVCVHMTKSVAAGVSADLRAVLRRLEEAEKDVKRIDWLRDRIAQSSISVCQSLGLDHRVVGLREAIDAAAPRPDAGGAG